jgi:hypothetical protein
MHTPTTLPKPAPPKLMPPKLAPPEPAPRRLAPPKLAPPEPAPRRLAPPKLAPPEPAPSKLAQAEPVPPGPVPPGPVPPGPVPPGLMQPRLATVPDAAPPYDCEVHGTACQVPGEHSAARPQPCWPPVGLAPALPVLGAAGAGSGTSCGGAIWPRQFAQAIIETLAGIRPMRQILTWTTDRAHAHIHALAPLLRTDTAPRIQRILTSQPSPAVAEVTVIAGFGPRTRAVAMRFEHTTFRPTGPGLPGRQARWLCTDVETG